jgi:hypothetical protein
MNTLSSFEDHINQLVAMGVHEAKSRTKSYFTKDYPGGMHLTEDPKTSAVPPNLLNVADVQTLKKMAGIDDAIFDHPSAPHIEALPHVNELTHEITDPLHPLVCQALNSYVFGDSRKVSSWAPLLNKLRFPMQIAAFVGDTIVVSPGNPLIIGTKDGPPVAPVFDKVEIQPGGQVICLAPAKPTFGTMSSQATAHALTQVGDPASITLLSRGGDGGDGGKGDGLKLPAASVGGKGSDATESGKSDCNPAGAGGTGGKGNDGTNGGNGGNGGDANPITYSVDVLNGAFVVGSIGGNGGNGGNAGEGQNGGPGGPGGNSCRSCGTGAQGPGGDGGNAGTAGLGGDGGNGDKVYINFKSGNATFTISDAKANGGNGGNGASGGDGGTGVPNNGNNGTPQGGAKGGNGGKPGTVIINGAIQPGH